MPDPYGELGQAPVMPWRESYGLCLLAHLERSVTTIQTNVDLSDRLHPVMMPFPSCWECFLFQDGEALSLCPFFTFNKTGSTVCVYKSLALRTRG